MEHLGLPAEEHVREGVMASRIAARAADIAKGVKGVWDEDKRFSEFRSQRNWEKQIALALDSKRATQYRNQRKPKKDEVCSMCGEICAYEIMKDDR